MAPALMRVARIAWAAPCSLVGLALAALVLPFGARMTRGPGVVELIWRESDEACGAAARRCPFRAMALGHVVLAVTRADLECARAHEMVHVRQYERWGALFFPAYALSSLHQLAIGGRPYRDNRFEVEARKVSGS